MAGIQSGEAQRFEVFLSYNSPDRETVAAIANALVGEGLNPFFDRWHLRPGEPWQEALEAALGNSTSVAVFLGDGGVGPWQNEELRSAIDIRVRDPAFRVIPVLLPGAGPVPESLPRFLRRFTFVDFRQGLNDRNALMVLISAVRGEAPKTNATNRVITLLESGTQSRSPTDRNRWQMLQRVREGWIAGVLDQSLYKIARIELGIDSRPEAIADPLHLIVQERNRDPYALPPSTHLRTVFDRCSGALLILGCPGSGKTTLLLELTRDLLDEAEREPELAMPVVFNLSTWGGNRMPIVEWLKEELCYRYHIPRGLARTWVDTEQILPLLDGLDEVSEEHRDDCVKAINAFRAAHGLMQLAVCSRTADYDLLSNRLELNGAVLVRPLTRDQVERYLNQAGNALRGLRTAVFSDAQLWELLETPLMLSIAMLAYGDVAPERILVPASLEERRHRLFTEYVDAMFRRRSKRAQYSPEAATRWLTRLASAMQRENRAVLYVEELGPELLPNRRSELLLTLAASMTAGVLFATVCMLCVSGIYTFIFIERGKSGFEAPLDIILPAMTAGIAAWISFSIFAVVLYMEAPQVAYRPIEVLRFSPKNILKGIRVGWRTVGSLSVSFGLLLGAIGLALGTLAGVILDVGIGGGLSQAAIVFALFGLLSGGLFYGIFGTVAGFMVGLVIVLAEMFGGELGARIRPNEGTRRSLRMASRVWMFGGFSAGLIGLVLGRSIAAGVSALLIGTLLAFFVGLVFGGFYCVQHYLLRLALYRTGFAPLNYVRFLDYAAERLFLRKLGGGYLFIHRLLLEHFAELNHDYKLPAA